MNLEKLRQSLIRHENKRRFPYPDTEGNWTIGVGHNLTAKGLPNHLILMLLQEDMLEAVTALGENYPWTQTIDDVRQRVLAEMFFNLGPRRFAGFVKMLAAAQAGDYQTAAIEMLDSAWSTQVGARATRLAEMMRSGLDPE